MQNAPLRKSKEKMLDFFGVSLWLAACAGMALVALVQFGQDFKGYYAASQVLLQGGNPYDFSLVAAVLTKTVGAVSNHPFYYPLWFGWLMVPLAVMPYQVARCMWMSINAGLWVFSLVQLSELLQWPRAGWHRYVMALFTTFLLAWVTWRYEQLGIALLALLVASLAAIRARRWLMAGLWLALLLVKPTITLLPVAAVLLWLMRQGQWRTVIATSLTCLFLTIVTTLATPGWYLPWLRTTFSGGLFGVMNAAGQVDAIRINSTMLDWLARLMPGVPWRASIYAACAILVLIVVAAFVLRSKSFMIVVVVAVLASFAITPYALQYDFPLLALPLYWSTALFVRTKRGLWGGLLLTAFVTSILFWERPISDAYWMVIGLTVLSGWSWSQARSSTLPSSLLWGANSLVTEFSPQHGTTRPESMG